MRKIKLRTLLLGVNLFAIVATSAAIISSTYTKYNKSIADFSKQTIVRVGQQIVERICCLEREFEQLPKMGGVFYLKESGIGIENTALSTFFLDAVQYFPDLFTYYLGTPDGGYLIAINMTFFGSSKELIETPPGTSYLILFRNGSMPKDAQMQAFYDADFELIGMKEVRGQTYDPRERPWYFDSIHANRLYWSEIHPFHFPRVENGISVSMPFYDKEGNLSAVVGAALSVDLFSKFLTEQTIGKSGQAFIVDGKGKALLPRDAPHSDLAKAAFDFYKRHNEPQFSFKFSHETYLAFFHTFPPTFQPEWKLAIIAPRSDFFSELMAAQRDAILISVAILAAASLFVTWLSIRISRPIVSISEEIDQMTHLNLEGGEMIATKISEIDQIESSVSSLKSSLRSFGRYVPKEIANQLMLKGNDIELGGEKKTITIFFTDIANFTSIAETFPIDTVTHLLAEHFDALSKIILAQGGAIDKFIGDSIMSIWGAPNEVPDHAARACTAALLCQKALSELNEKQKQTGLPEFATRMGINSGVAIVGNFGTPERMNYSVIGDAVNTASRLQVLNKNYETKIIIGEETKRDIGPQFLVRPLGLVEVRGKKNKIRVFELVAKFQGESSILPKPGQEELCKLFAEAYEVHEQGNLAEAKRLFTSIAARFPEDVPTQVYLKKN
ncbi:MAG: hypothetical protein JSS32_03710 [Verrucomicrobia bacterium]|nr:hypothetical protein [Verrucomicrobiota bacterium]